MPRTIGYGTFTPARKVALRKAQLESARKRRKYHSDTRSPRRIKKAEEHENRRRRKVALGLAAAGAIAAAGAGIAVYQQSKNQGPPTRENPLSFNTNSSAGTKKAVAYGRSLTRQTREEWSKTPEGARQFEAIKAYTGPGQDYAMGTIMRGGELPLGYTDNMRSQLQSNVDLLDSAFDSENVTPMPNWTEVTRSTTLKDFYSDDAELNQLLDEISSRPITMTSETMFSTTEEEVSVLKEKMLGKTFTNKSVTSTSLSTTPAIVDKGVVIHYSMPPGTRALYVADRMVGEDYTGNLLGKFLTEKEIILRRNLTYKILDMKREKDGQIVVNVEGLL